MRDHRIDVRPVHRRPGRAAPARVRPRRRRARGAGPSFSSATWPASTKAPRTTQSGPSSSQAPSLPPPGAAQPGTRSGPSVPEDDLDAVTLTHAEVRTVLTSLDLAADWKRDRAGMCADCPDQSCFACQLRLQDARTYDQLAVQLLHDEQATRDERSQPGRASSPMPPIQPRPAAEMEAGQ